MAPICRGIRIIHYKANSYNRDDRNEEVWMERSL